MNAFDDTHCDEGSAVASPGALVCDQDAVVTPTDRAFFRDMTPVRRVHGILRYAFIALRNMTPYGPVHGILRCTSDVMARLDRAIPRGITPFCPVHGNLRCMDVVMARLDRAIPRHTASFFLLLLICLCFGCQQGRAPSGGLYARSALDILPVLQDQRWAWGMGSPTLLVRGHMTADKREDVLVVAEPVVRRGWPWQHFFLLKGPGLSPADIVAPKIVIAPGVKGFRWGQKILRPTSAMVHDVDKDGHLDVIVGYRNGRVAIFRGDGAGHTWQLSQILSCERIWAFQGAQIQLIDWAQDGLIDVAVLGRSGYLMLWQQRPKGRFSPRLLRRGHASIPRGYKAMLQQWPKPPTMAPKAPPKSATRAVKANSRPTSRPLSLNFPSTRPANGPDKASLKHPLRIAPDASTRGALTASQEWSKLRAAHGLLALDLDGDGRQDLLVAGSDSHKGLWLWPLYQSRSGRVRRLVPGRRRRLVASWPASSPIATAKLIKVSQKDQAGPAMLAVTSAFGHLNSRGVAFVRRFRYIKPRPPLRYPYGVGRQWLLWEPALSFGVTAGRFGGHGVVVVAPSRVRALTTESGWRGSRYDLRRDPIIGGRISLRGAVGCDLDGKGRDALVMLGIGAIGQKARLGVHLLIHRKPLISQIQPRTTQSGKRRK